MLVKGAHLDSSLHGVNSVQSLSRVRLFATPRIAACQASLSITISRSSLRLTSIGSVMPSSHIILCRPLLLLPPIPPKSTILQQIFFLSAAKKSYFHIRFYSQVHEVRTPTYMLWEQSSIQDKGTGVILPPKARFPRVHRDGGVFGSDQVSRMWPLAQGCGV